MGGNEKQVNEIIDFRRVILKIATCVYLFIASLIAARVVSYLMEVDRQ